MSIRSKLHSFLGILLLSMSASADVGLTDRQDQQLDIQGLHFTDEGGKDVPLAKYFHSRTPVLLTMVYYECPMLCTVVLNQLTQELKRTNLIAGSAFEMVAVSINPEEDSALAAKKKESYLRSIGLPAEASGFHFLVGHKDAIDQLAQQIGFGYVYNAETKQYDHPSVVFALSPSGKLIRTITGVQFNARGLHQALAEAEGEGEGEKPLSAFSRMILYCQQPVNSNVVLYSWCAAFLAAVVFVLFAVRRRKNKT